MRVKRRTRIGRALGVVVFGSGVLLTACGPVPDPAPPPSVPVVFATPGATTYVVPPTVCAITIAADGGHGGAGLDNATPGPGSAGGAGAHVSVHLAVVPGTVLVVVVGGSGADATNLVAGAGGFAGGGGGSGGANTGGGGGGASLVATTAPIVVAGGGGGGGGAAGPTGAGGAAGPIGSNGTTGGAAADGGRGGTTTGGGGAGAPSATGAGGGGGTALTGSGAAGGASGGAGGVGNANAGGGGGGGGGLSVGGPGGAGGAGTAIPGSSGSAGAGGTGTTGGGAGGSGAGGGGGGGAGGLGFGGGGGGSETGAGGGGAGWGGGGGGATDGGGGGGSSFAGSGTTNVTSAASILSGNGQVIISHDSVTDACPITAPVGHVPGLVHQGPPTRPLVALSIDDLWGASGARDVNAVMDILAAKHVKGITFFPTGGALEQHHALGYDWVWRRVARSNSEIGNHTYTHTALTKLNNFQIYYELQHTQDWLNLDLGAGFHYQMHLMRPPGGNGGYGNGDPRILPFVNSMGLSMIMWSIETHGSGPVHARFVRWIISQARPGSIVLMHFTQITPTEIGQVIDGLRRKGLEPTTVTSLYP